MMSTAAFIALVILVHHSWCLETPSPEKILLPRNYNLHPYRQSAVQTRQTAQNRNGPVLFPNDSPPPPRTPLIVTSRPITEQIARSELGDATLTPKPPTQNLNQRIQQIPTINDYQNQIQSLGDNARQVPSQYSGQNRYKEFTNNVPNAPANYKFYGYTDGARVASVSKNNNNLGSGTNEHHVDPSVDSRQFSIGFSSGADRSSGFAGTADEPSARGPGNIGRSQSSYLEALAKSTPNLNESLLEKHPYAAVAKKLKLEKKNQGKEYNSQEERTVVPPIYNALGNYARSKVLNDKGKRKQKASNRYYDNEVNTAGNPSPSDGDADDYYTDNSPNEAKQYAFSYSVRDHHTGDDFSHSQRNTGTATNGEYRVKLPDGRLQIVSYTADNGGYKADVRYQDDPEVANSKQQAPQEPVSRYHHPAIAYQNDVRSTVQTLPDVRNQAYALQQQKLGRIVVPSQEEKDYQDVEYYYEDDGYKNPKTHYVTNDDREILITSKPGYLQTPATTPSNVLYKQLIYHGNDDRNPNYAVTPTQFVYVQSSPSTFVSNPEEQQQENLEDKKYLHFYDAESVKFVSTTPKYVTVSDNSIAPISPTSSSHFDTSSRQNGGYYTSSTPAPVFDSYDHLDSPDVQKYDVKHKVLYNGQRHYTSVTPVYRQSSVASGDDSVSSTPVYENVQSNAKGAAGLGLGLGRYFAPSDSIDLRKYFTFKKR